MYALMILFGGSCYGQQQKRCLQFTLLFTDTKASDAEKKETAAIIRQRFDNAQVEADIGIDHEKIIAKIACTATPDVRALFIQHEFAIYETYTGAELSKYVPMIPHETSLPDFSQVNSAMLYTGKLNDLKYLQSLFYPDSSKTAGPDDVDFYPGMIQQDNPAVAIYAVKTPVHYRPVTIRMIREITAKKTVNGTGYDIVITFKEAYKKIWADMVMKNQGRALAVISDHMVLTCRVVYAPIENGTAVISCMMQDKAAIDEIVKRIKFSLPLNLVIGREEMIAE